MPRRYRRPALALGLVAVVAVSLAMLAGSTGGQVAAKKSPKLAGDPDRASMLKLNAKSLSLPKALGREAVRTSVSKDIQDLQDRAYPSKTLPFSWRKGAIDYYSRSIRGRGNDDNNHGWQLAGPTTATYPAVLNRSNSDYVASGRVSAMAIGPTCTASDCRVWVAAAGGGVWRTDQALAANVSWKFVSGSFATNAIGSLTYDHGTLYAGTGEPNSSGDSEAGLGVYRSTDNGDSWSLLPGSVAAAAGNSVASIAVDPANSQTLYIATTLGVRGVSGNSGGAVLDPNAPAVGVYKSTDGGRSFTLVLDDSNGAWGATHVEIDTNGDIYASANAEGIYRSRDGGSTWELVFKAVDQSGFGRTEFALTKKDGQTRIWIADGGDQQPTPTPDLASYDSTSGVYRGDAIDTKTAAQLAGVAGDNSGYTALSTWDRTQPGYLTWDYCWAQCSYDNFVVTPAGHPDTVYVGGAYNYDFPVRNNGRTVLLSTDAGTSWWDQTKDIPAADGTQNGIHPDQHALVVNPNNPLQFFEGSDGGVVRSSGVLADGRADCVGRVSPASASYAACRNALEQIPTRIDSLNAGLSTLQFGAISVDPSNPKNIQGGTQDNGTFEGLAGAPNWGQTMYGDGGVSAFDISNTGFRMNEFYTQYTDVNFQGGAPEAWVVVSAPFFASGEASAFYKPQINDPAVSGTLFVGLDHVWRTQDFGGDRAYLEANCPEFFTYGDQPGCGDFVPLGDPSGQGGTNAPGSLTAAGVYGTDKSGGYIVRIARTPSDHNTMWVATRRGRLFISKNADDANAGAVSFKRLDDAPNRSASSLATPRRFISGVVVDPKNPNHAFVSFGGYNSATDGVTPAVPGHVFDVVYDPLTGKATWTSLDRGNGPLGDLPVTDLARDDKTGRLYAATDFNVLVQKGDSGKWRLAAGGMPMVEVSGLTIEPKSRTLYASTHGRAIWSLQLQNDGNNNDNNDNGGGKGKGKGH